MYKLSIIIPVYNVRDFIIACLQSIERQDYIDEIEVIVVDDGSPDDTVSLIQTYMKTSKLNINIVSQANQGIGGARNTGISNASGEYIWFIDPDDTIQEYCVKDIYDYAHDNDLDVVIFDLVDVDEQGNELYVEVGADSSMHRKVLDKETGRSLLTYVQSPTNRWIKKSLWQNVKYLPVRCFEDFDTIPKVTSLGSRFGYLNKHYYFYLQRSTSLMHEIDGGKFALMLDVVRDLEEYFLQRQEFQQEIEYLIIENAYLMTTVRLLKSKEGIHAVRDMRDLILSNHKGYWKNPYMSRLTMAHKVYLKLLDLNFVMILQFMVKMFFK